MNNEINTWLIMNFWRLVFLWQHHQDFDIEENEYTHDVVWVAYTQYTLQDKI